MKWRWIEKRWSERPDWITRARLAFILLTREYRNKVAIETPPLLPCSAPYKRTEQQLSDDDDISDDEPPVASIEQELADYEREPRLRAIKLTDSPIDYWWQQRSRWPHLSALAVDVYSTLTMSDEPERVFSETGALIGTRRRSLKAETTAELITLKH